MSENTIADLNAQIAIIGTCWYNLEARAIAKAHLKPAYFVGADRELFEAVTSRIDRFAWVEVAHKFSDKAKARAEKFSEFHDYFKPDFDKWVELVRKKALLRQYQALAARLHRNITPESEPDDISASIIQSVVDIRDKGKALKSHAIDNAIDEALAIEERWHQDDPFADSVQTGFAKLDRILGGLQRGHVTTLMAESGMGKTALAIQIMRNVALRAKAEQRDAMVYFFSMEMTAPSIIFRLAQINSGISTSKVRFKDVQKKDREKYIKAAQDMRGLNIKIDPCSGLKPKEMLDRVIAAAAQHKDGTELIVLDFIELPASDQRHGKTQALDLTMNKIKEIAKETNAPFLNLSQITLDGGSDRKPDGKARYSEMIRNLSQAMLCIYRPGFFIERDGRGNSAIVKEYERMKKDGGNCEILIPKNRDGIARRPVLMHFEGPITRFSEVNGMQAVKDKLRDKEIV